MGGETTISFTPLLPWGVVLALALPAAAVILFGLFRRARGIVWRTAAVAVVLLALVNPTFVVEQREYLPNIAVVVVDDSPSQRIGDRKARSEAALAGVRAAVEQIGNIELRVVHGGADRGQGGDGTHLFGPLDRVLSDIPRRRLAGVIMVTDGQVHDVPQEIPPDDETGAPLHVLLTGERGERDRRLVLRQSPSYGIVGSSQQLTIRVEDLDASPGGAATGEARVTVRRDGEPWQTRVVPIGRDYTIPFQLDHAGTTFFELEADAAPGELTRRNNRAVAAVNGVRDRLRVLLISGEPHPGERTWRNLLKADPSVDLVHFTILRPPEKQDRTPVAELSLISFPVHELFEVKLSEFDLIIFDRYRRRGVLLNRYLDNIATYVEQGGALLVAVGPAFSEGFSLYNTALGRVLPGAPTRRVFLEGFRARVSDVGARHPVTADLAGGQGAADSAATGEAAGSAAKPPWGRWFRQMEVDALRGTTLMQGVANRPLLIVDRVGEGRVAQILSDHIWLWSRGFDGGGPQAELLRRVAHWLMKEPELEEDMLSAAVRGGRLEILRRSLEPDDSPVEVTSPSGQAVTVELAEKGGGRAIGDVAIDETGIYRISDGKRTALAAAGALNPLETADARTTEDRLRPLVEARGGGIFWLADGDVPEVRQVKPGRDMAGAARFGRRGWLGLRSEQDYVVTGVDEVPLLPALLVLLAGLGTLVLAWRREGE